MLDCVFYILKNDNPVTESVLQAEVGTWDFTNTKRSFHFDRDVRKFTYRIQPIRGRGTVSGAYLYQSWDWSSVSAVGNKSVLKLYTACECSICPTCQWKSCFCYKLPSLQAGAHMARRVVTVCLLYMPQLKPVGDFPKTLAEPICMCVCIYIVDSLYGVYGGAVGWGTALQAGRSRIRFPMESLVFFITLACNRNKYQGYLLGRKGDRHIAGMTTVSPSCFECLENYGSLNLLEP